MEIITSQRYETIGLVILGMLFVIPVALSVAVILDLIRSRMYNRKVHRRLLYSAIATDLILGLCLVDAWFIEPRLLTVTNIHLASTDILKDTGAIKIAHISDIHYEKDTDLTRKLLQAIADNHPDLICITGDIYQCSEFDRAGFKSFLTKFCSIAPTSFVCGYDDEKAIIDASSGKAQYVGEDCMHLIIRGTVVEIAGMSSKNSKPNKNNDVVRIILNHTPDDFDKASDYDADLYLAGHTHGGQIRLPFWGAIITNCLTGKKYEYGLYQNNGAYGFITRGIGLEPLPAPPVRFSCPPEVVIIEISR